jgi:transcriptional regulator with XRE-family HTH domain
VTPAEVVRARKAAGLTQKQAGETASVDERTWQRWELGEVSRVRRSAIQPVIDVAKRKSSD